MRFRTVLFDLDGTLVDAFTTICRSYQHALPLLGYPAPTMEQVRRAVGGGLENAMLNFVPAEKVPALRDAYLPFYHKILFEDLRLMPGGRALVTGLHARGVTCGVLTNKLGGSSREICAHLGLSTCFKGVFGAGDTPWLKPQPEFAAHALHALGADPATTCLLGDSPFDVKAALNGGFVCFGVTTGTHTAEQLLEAGAAAVYRGFPELAAAQFPELAPLPEG